MTAVAAVSAGLVSVLAAAAMWLTWQAPQRRLRLALTRLPASAPASHAVRPAPPAAVAVPTDLALLIDLTAAVLRAGEHPMPALSAVVAALEDHDPVAEVLAPTLATVRLGASPETAWASLPDWLAPLRDPLLLSAATGAPAAALLQEQAARLRSRRRGAEQAAAARLGSLLVLPLGLCTLPAFALLGVVPVVLSLLGDTLGP